MTFPVSDLTSGQNQELVAYSLLFPNVVPNGHWWYSNVPPYIRKDLGERLAAVPKTKLIGYYSDAYKLEFVDEIRPEDLRFESRGINVVVDPKSLPYLDGTELDFAREGLNEGFKFNNPNVKDECGCGESFNV